MRPPVRRRIPEMMAKSTESSVWTAGYAAVLFLALALRLLALDRFSLGNDEIEEARWSRLPVGELLRVAGLDGAHPPLEFLVQAAIERTGTPEWVRRVPSVFGGAATVVLVAFLARRWFGNAGGIAAGVLIAVSPIHIRYSQEVRPYALGIFFLVASIAALEEYRRSSSRRMALLWFLGVLAAAYTLYFAGLMAVLASVTFIVLERKMGLRVVWRMLPIVLVGWALLYGPWLPFVLSLARRPPPVAREILDAQWLRYRLEVLGTGDWRMDPISVGSYCFWALVLVGLLSARLSRPATLAATWLIGGASVQLLLLQLRPHYPAVRHFLPVWIAAILLAGHGVAALSRTRHGQWLAVGTIVALLLFDARSLRAYYDHGRPEWDRIAAYLARNVHSPEHLVVANSWVFRNLGYYWNDRGLGRGNVPLERVTDQTEGPAWLVIAICPMSPEMRQKVDSLPVRMLSPNTNGCEVRFLPTGRQLLIAGGFCLRDT